jgi:hypothetical protein
MKPKKMNKFQPQFSILPAEQLRLWPELKPVSGLGYVLYGGTAIALRLGHRTSVDFDFLVVSVKFCKKGIDGMWLDEIKKLRYWIRRFRIADRLWWSSVS